MSRMWKIFIIVSLVLIITDAYTTKALWLWVREWDSRLLRWSVVALHFLTPVAIIFWFYKLGQLGMMDSRDPALFKHFFMFGGIVFLIYLPKIVFLSVYLLQDVVNILLWMVERFAGAISSRQDNVAEFAITRIDFLQKIGLVLAAVPFVSILYGIGRGRFQFKVEHHHLSFPDLPGGFDGVRIIHLSDIHLGSFLGNEKQVARAIEMINRQEADYIMFTGDLVNNFAEELDGWLPLFKQLKARNGMFSILGNHDYGDYVSWRDGQEKQANLDRIKDFHKLAGFRLLLNESVDLKHGKDSITLSGVENWGLPPFPQYGNLATALDGREQSNGFKILLSHDPSHWDAEILPRTNVRLTLSGHTHGMQFGIRIAGWQWSPVKYKYPRFSGLYTLADQRLMVNRGFGYIGFPGRIGMPPDISVITLHRG